MTTANSFSRNVRYSLTWHGWTAADLGSEIWGGQGKKADTPRRRINRLVTGAIRVSLADLERVAGALSVPPAVLAYGSLLDVRCALGER